MDTATAGLGAVNTYMNTAQKVKDLGWVKGLMSQQFNLPFGAIAPAAKPVDFYIAPRERNIAQPTQPAMFPALKGVSTVGTAGTTFVQGSNQYKDLARSLAPFSKALVETATTGLQYASWQMDVGEQAAMEQTGRGLRLGWTKRWKPLS